MTNKEKYAIMSRPTYKKFMVDMRSFMQYMNEHDVELKKKSVRTIADHFFKEYAHDPVYWYEYAIDLFLDFKK